MSNSKLLEDSLRLFSLVEPYKTFTPQQLLVTLVLPLKTQKAKVFYQGDKLVGFASWAWLKNSQEEGFLSDSILLTEEDYLREKEDDASLWGLDFIAPFGHTTQLIRALKKDIDTLYGSPTEVKWRRVYDRHKIHRKNL